MFLKLRRCTTCAFSIPCLLSSAIPLPRGVYVFPYCCAFGFMLLRLLLHLLPGLSSATSAYKLVLTLPLPRASAAGGLNKPDRSSLYAPATCASRAAAPRAHCARLLLSFAMYYSCSLLYRRPNPSALTCVAPAPGENSWFLFPCRVGHLADISATVGTLVSTSCSYTTLPCTFRAML